jgi:hypothetical protein
MTGRLARRLGVGALVAMAAIAGGGRFPGNTVLLAQAADADDLKIRALLQRIERAAQQNDPSTFVNLRASTGNEALLEKFARDQFQPDASRVVIEERDRASLPGTLPGNGYTLTVDAFMEFGARARVATWLLEIKRVDDDWRMASAESISSIENLYKLAVNTTKQFDASNFAITSEDFDLTLAEGSVFVVETDRGVTGLIVNGRGDVRFHPEPDTEKGQLRIFAGADTLNTRFDAAYIRFGTLEQHADLSTLKPRAVDPRELRRAQDIFREESVKSFVVDLADLSRDTWSLLPGTDDFLAEIRTRRFNTLTYMHAASEAEDIAFFDRKHQKTISSYASKEKLATRGRFYNEDDLAPYDVLDYDIDITALPDRLWLDGVATMRLRVTAPTLTQLNIRLADSLVVRSITSRQFGRLLGIRVPNQNMVMINLPALLLQDTEFELTFTYGGRLPPQPTDKETLLVGAQDPSLPSLPVFDDPLMTTSEPNYLYSNRSYWYPQSTVTDYATATIQISVPLAYGCIASGEPSPDSPALVNERDPQQGRKVYVFNAPRPARYLAFLVSKMTRADRWTVVFGPDAPPPATSLDPDSQPYTKLDLIVDAQSRQMAKGKEIAERTADIIQFYESSIGDAPYSTFMLALVEAQLPGGHSPAFFAVLNQQSPFSTLSWRNDPAAFANYPEFFLAHEVAHQWWGQAVGWRNYHEQWLSEGFAQYFAALYAQKLRGDNVFDSMMRQMRRWAIDQSDQGPVYLGYRVGHIKDDGRAFRAIVYNKGAVVLHMLRQIVGDENFFAALRRFYTDSRFTKVGSEDFQYALEQETGMSFDRFFEKWVYGTSIPRVAFSYRVESGGSGTQEAVLHFEQGEDYSELPVTVTLQYADRRTVDIIVPLLGRTVDRRVTLDGPLRTADINRDQTMAEIVKAASPQP